MPEQNMKEKKKALLGFSQDPEDSCAAGAALALHGLHAVLHHDFLAILYLDCFPALHASSFRHIAHLKVIHRKLFFVFYNVFYSLSFFFNVTFKTAFMFDIPFIERLSIITFLTNKIKFT